VTVADFKTALALTLKAEGGYGNDPQDPGGETYKGIARKMNSKWAGWTRIDSLKGRSNFPRCLDDDEELKAQIESFYEVNYWDRINGDKIKNQDIAESIFDFGVNSGVIASAKIAQTVLGEAADGVIGDGTLAKLNQEDPRTFLALFALHKIARYADICKKRPESKKFFFGWVNRTLEGL
jgi:lysozyme family protein